MAAPSTRGEALDRAGRVLSPAGFALVILLFLLPFAAASCSNDPGVLAATASSGGSEAQVQQACTHDVAGYSGYALVAGTDPAIDSGCLRAAAGDAGLGQRTAAPTAGDLNIGPQPLFIAAILMVIAGLGLSLGPWRRRSLIAAVSALLTAILCAVGEGRVEGPVLQRIADLLNNQDSFISGSSAATPDELRLYLQVHAGLGYRLVLLVLLVIAVFNLAVFAIRSLPEITVAWGSGDLAPSPAPVPLPQPVIPEPPPPPPQPLRAEPAAAPSPLRTRVVAPPRVQPGQESAGGEWGPPA